jgi:hypothetical protein
MNMGKFGAAGQPNEAELIPPAYTLAQSNGHAAAP